MKTKFSITKNWWVLTIVGVLLSLLGIWVYYNPVVNYIGLSILFSIMMFVSGAFEIVFAVGNSKLLKGWGWLMSAGIFDMILGSILFMREDITMQLLPYIFGIWLIFKGVTQIGKGIMLKEHHLTRWGWPLFGGIFVILFGILVVYSPVFGAESIVIWTALSLIFLGVISIIFSLVIKKIKIENYD